MLAEVLRPQQPRFLGRHERKDLRALRLHRRTRSRVRNREDRRNAGRVVVRAIVDRVPIHRRSDAEMIVMCAVHYVL